MKKQDKGGNNGGGGGAGGAGGGVYKGDMPMAFGTKGSKEG